MKEGCQTSRILQKSCPAVICYPSKGKMTEGSLEIGRAAFATTDTVGTGLWGLRLPSP